MIKYFFRPFTFHSSRHLSSQGTLRLLTRWRAVCCFCRHLRPRCAARTRSLSLSAATSNSRCARRRDSKTKTKKTKEQNRKEETFIECCAQCGNRAVMHMHDAADFLVRRAHNFPFDCFVRPDSRHQLYAKLKKDTNKEIYLAMDVSSYL